MGRRKRSRLITSGMLREKHREEETVAPARPARDEAAETAVAFDLDALATRVRARRREMKWTQADVAGNGGPPAKVISEIERSRNPRPDADVLDRLDTGLEWPPGTSATILRAERASELAAAR
ncbi:helix-turn-helix transcriptional regulator [Nocardia implantans]|uniref:Helix-turn-helix transcriptional regulator n=1 Tax=Nocardia implantans TaxID=3108168 RepID=A0ABU6B0E5_9NOCA|nr:MULTISPECIES: helix-turn-helix transcriptional regulator [unclassified Nocardia]MBF6194056.1 helix-turn-helix domain-containing protein [Nocardia beijingensis]MEA3529663.1 helix-turn-helix transcriptional regulator [Nocardia sp. CDC192]MEB3512859.1 helix-turn-helix transcriptional regulator [Nocardia sp. CDC186]